MAQRSQSFQGRPKNTEKLAIMLEISKTLNTGINFLCRFRQYFLLIFGISGISAFIFLFTLKNQLLFGGMSFLAHIAIFLWLITEAFGSIAQKRSSFNRILARTFLFFLHTGYSWSFFHTIEKNFWLALFQYN